ncbi:MAG: transporter substrate-binding domain-containing protein [Planctomycetota bacterium]|nr:transporter substrate-binding domain-containing protein [Planctomycetota bacterium]
MTEHFTILSHHTATDTLRVGVVHNPPLSVIGADGSIEGLLPQVWREAAARAQIPYEFVIITDETASSELAAGHLDMVVNAVDLTPQTLAVTNFTTPLMQGNLRAVVRSEDSITLPHLLKELWQSDLWVLLGIAAALGITVASLMVFAERRRHGSMSKHNRAKRLEHSVWWSIVTFSAVGYGDVVPYTRVGRLIASAWMLTSVLMVALISSIVASEFTVVKLRPSIDSVMNVSGKLVAVLSDRDAERLNHLGAIVQVAPTLESGLTRLSSGAIDGLFLSDVELIIASQAIQRSGFRTLGGGIPSSFLAFPLRDGLPSDLVRKLNAALAETVRSSVWRTAPRLLGHTRVIEDSGEGG